MTEGKKVLEKIKKWWFNKRYKTITEEMDLQKQWYEEARNQTMKTLPKFLKKLARFNHDYGTICHVLSAGAVGTAWALNSTPQGGITGFQASMVMWMFVKHWYHKNNKCGLRIWDFDLLLYPQYGYRFDKTISPDTWADIQAEAKKRLEETEFPVHSDVKAHWESIVAGVVPHGFEVKEND